MSDKQVDRINALLAKAEAASTQEEADTYNAKASELMIRYGVEQAMLAAARGEADAKEEIVQIKVDFTGQFAKSHMMLAWLAAQALTGEAVSGFKTRHYRGSGVTLTLIGYESDVSSVKAMIASLLLQCESELFDWWEYEKAAYKGQGQYDKTVARRSFIEGYSSAASKKIRDVYSRVVKEEQAKETGTAVALVDRKKQVNDYIRDNYHVGKGRASYSRSDAAGRSAGRAAGARADVGGRGVSNSRGRIGR